MSQRTHELKRVGKGADLADPHHNLKSGDLRPDRSDNANSGAPAPQAPRLQKVIRPGDLHLYSGLSRSQIAILIGEGKFPRPIRLSDRACGWLEDEVTDWQEEKRRERDGRRQP